MIPRLSKLWFIHLSWCPRQIGEGKDEGKDGPWLVMFSDILAQLFILAIQYSAAGPKETMFCRIPESFCCPLRPSEPLQGPLRHPNSLLALWLRRDKQMDR